VVSRGDGEGRVCRAPGRDHDDDCCPPQHDHDRLVAARDTACVADDVASGHNGADVSRSGTAGTDDGAAHDGAATDHDDDQASTDHHDHFPRGWRTGVLRIAREGRRLVRAVTAANAADGESIGRM
jgi:hypothetical protein